LIQGDRIMPLSHPVLAIPVRQRRLYMTVFDIIRNAILAGFGVQEKMKDFVEDLVKRGELSESQGAKLVKEWSDKADKTTTELSEMVTSIIPMALEKMNVPSKGDIEVLNEQLEKLSARIAAFEGARDSEKIL
jgi:polyhydroxyalkanoate synthesis regulator phasin